MNIIDAKEISWKPDSVEAVKKDAEALIAKTEEVKPIEAPVESSVEAPTSLMGKLKSVVRKAVDCCIE